MSRLSCRNSEVDSCKRIIAVLSCRHIICYECVLRMVLVTEQKTCPVCTEVINQIIITAKSFASHQDAADYLQNSKSTTLGHFLGIVYYDEPSLYDDLKIISWFRCNACNTDFSRL